MFVEFYAAIATHCYTWSSMDGLSVCQSVTFVSLEKTAELI